MSRSSVWVDSRVIDEVNGDVRKHNRLLETGGPLFGYEADGELVVVHARGVGAHARRRPSAFEPEWEAVDRAIEEVDTASGGRYRYVGSWHTHPGGESRPSSRDHEAASGIAAEAQVGLPAPVLLIAATRRLPGTRRRIRSWQLWRLNNHSGQLERQKVRVTALDQRLV